VHQNLENAGIPVITQVLLQSHENDTIGLANIFTEKLQQLAAKSVLIVGLRRPNDSLYQTLISDPEANLTAGIKSVDRIGDCLAPGAIVHAVYSGHDYARNLDTTRSDLYLRDIPIAVNPPGAVI